jgi:hypothetical protein
MADIETVNRYAAADGRRVEQRVAETQQADHKERVVETHVEQVPYMLEERITEKVVPIVTERRKEKFNKGELVDTEIERVSDESLHLHPPGPKLVTKADVEDAVHNVLARMDFRQEKTVNNKISVEDITPVASNKINEWIDTGLYVILSGELAFIVYQLFLRGMLGQ